MLPGKVLNVTDAVAIARRRLWLIVIPPVITFFAALLYSSTIPSMYESDMLIAIDPQRVPDEFVRSTVTLQTDRRMDALQVKVLSRTTLHQLIDEFDLYREKRQRLAMEEVIVEMREDIGIVLETVRTRGQERQPSAFHVRFLYDDPKIAAEVTARLGVLFVNQNIEDRGAVAGATNRFLEKQLEEARGKLEAQERLLENFRQQHGQELPTQTQANVQSLSSAQLQAQSLVESVARDRDRKQMLERLYREAAKEPPLASAAVPQDGGVPAVGSTAQQQLASARASLASLEQRYRPDHPDVMRARRQVSDLEPKAAEEARAADARSPAANPVTVTTDPNELARRERLRGMAAEIESLDRQVAFKESEERRVRAEITEYQRRLEAVPRLESAWVKLTRDYDTQQLAYRELLTKSTAAQAAVNLEGQDIGERFRIVDPALVPVLPLRSKRLRYNAAGLAFGLFLGVGITALLELRDKSFWTESDVIDVLALPVLATVPYVATAAEKERSKRRLIAASVGGTACVAIASYVTWSLKLWNSLR